MKLPGFLSLAKGLSTLTAELHGIHLQLTRIADCLDPPLLAAPPPEKAEISYQGHDEAERIELIEQTYLRYSGRLPTEEELVRELDGEEVPQQLAERLMKERMTIPPPGELH